MSERLASIVEALGEPFYRDSEGCALYHGDSLDLLPMLPANCIDSIVTDPPYGLSFMGKAWDHGVPGVAFWQAMLAAAKPGATLLSFGGTRTYHRMAVAIEDAGWEIRDCIQWLYGSGFPKSLDVSKAIDKAAGAEREVVGQKVYADGTQGSWRTSSSDKYAQDEWTKDATDRPKYETAPATDAAREWSGYGTALKPANEPICVAMKPLDGTFAKNAERWGVAGLNIDGGRIEGAPPSVPQPRFNSPTGQVYGMKTGEGRSGEMSVASGRWPANVIHDGSEEVVGLFPTTTSGVFTTRKTTIRGDDGNTWNTVPTEYAVDGCKGGDSGSAARFFYAAKASRKERGAYNTHPTVKPLSLMEYLCRLTMTPTGGIVLDPFAGSGTTLLAARKLGRPCIGFEKEEAHCEIIARRLSEGRMQLA